MGCWNHTCAITNLPIYAGEEVEVILLRANSNVDGASFCYPNAYHSPLPLTFSGEYNDFGGVENCNGVALNTIIAALKERLFEMDVGENEYHDIPTKKDEFDIDKLFELDHESRLFITHTKMHHDKRECVRIKHIVVRKEVYDGIIKGMTFYTYDPAEPCANYIGYEDLLLDSKQFTKDLDDVLAMDKNITQGHYWMMDNSIGGSRVGRMLAYDREGGYEMNNLIRVTELLFNMRQDGHTDYKAMLANALHLSILTTFMLRMRRSWVIPSGVGSQDSETDCQELCAKLTLASAENIKHRWDEE